MGILKKSVYTNILWVTITLFWSACQESGYILLNSGDTIQGKINILDLSIIGDQQSKYFKWKPFQDNVARGTPIMIDVDSIKFIKVKTTTLWTIFNPHYSKYVPFKDHIWLCLGSKNEVGLYSRGIEGDIIFTGDGMVSSITQTKMILISAGTEIKIPFDDNPFYSEKYYFVKFINERYGSNFQVKDFKDSRAAINYILDAEDERLQKVGGNER